MKPKHQRLWFVATAMIMLVAGSLLVANTFRENLIFFYSPTELDAGGYALSDTMRLGGLVKYGSFQRLADDSVKFTVTDNNRAVCVDYAGMLPALFREGQGVVVEGKLAKGNCFQAARVLTKHDENYMPKEVVDSLKKSGRWQDQ